MPFRLLVYNKPLPASTGFSFSCLPKARDLAEIQVGEQGREGERIKRLKGRKVFIILLFREGRQAAALEECVAKADSVEELNKLVLSRCLHSLFTHIYL